jgi:hypothetical protein
MNIETVDELVDQIADWIGVYGCCKAAETNDDCEDTNPCCCRVGFHMVMGERIRNAVHNEEELAKLDIKNPNP